MIRHHVAQGAGALVVLAPPLDPKLLRHGDLHMVDVATVPDRLEDAVRESKHQNVLNRIFAEVMIDPIDLPLLDALEQLSVQRTRRRKILAEGLLDHDPAPAIWTLFGQTGHTQLPDGLGEEAWRCGEVVQTAAARRMPCIHVRQHALEALVRLRILKVAAREVQPLHQPAPPIGVELPRQVLTNVAAELLAKVVVAPLTVRQSHDRELLGQKDDSRPGYRGLAAACVW